MSLSATVLVAPQRATKKLNETNTGEKEIVSIERKEIVSIEKELVSIEKDRKRKMGASSL
jgi:hypothetical protein